MNMDLAEALAVVMASKEKMGELFTPHKLYEAAMKTVVAEAERVAAFQAQFSDLSGDNS